MGTLITDSERHSNAVWTTDSCEGLTLIETLIATLIISFGLLCAGQMMFVAAASASLSRSKSSAAFTAQNKLEALAERYRQNPAAPDLAVGLHGPQPVQVLNSVDGSTLNNYGVSWTVNNVEDPRPAKMLHAKQVTVTVMPLDSDGKINIRSRLNKVVSITGVLSAALQ